ncbi:MAG: transporter substrate-binding domain-containing protein [Desulfovibrionales bacterium]
MGASLKKMLLTVFPIVLMMFVFTGGVHAGDKGTIVLSADEWPPFNIKPDTAKPGYMVEIAKSIYEPKGYKIKYKVMPWSRAIKECRTGNINGIFAPYKSDAPDFVFPEQSAGTYGFNFYTAKNSKWNFSGLNSLTDVMLGSIADYSYGKEMDEYIKNNPSKVDINRGSDPLTSNIKKLFRDRIDVLIATGPVFDYTASEMGVKNKVRFAGEAVASEPCYIAFSPALKNSGELAGIYDSGISRLRKSGKLQEILSRYGLTDWK